MSVGDRRSGSERRSTNRYPVTMDVEWEGTTGRQPGTVSDVSLDGCFVLSSGEVVDGETVKILIPLEGGMKVQFDGKVVNHFFEIGFGVRFEMLSVGQRDILAKMVRD